MPDAHEATTERFILRPREERARAGLALSGGGFRAALFHLGTLLRLNELAWLPRLGEVASASGGSLVAAQLGWRWRALEFESGVAKNLDALVIDPIRAFCARTVDKGPFVRGVLHPFTTPAELLARRYREHLFGDANLQDLPEGANAPRFTLFGTSLQTGASVQFSRAALVEYRLGKISSPTTDLAIVVAISTGFPPFFCPTVLKLDPDAWTRFEISDLHDSVLPSGRALRSTMLLGDGGIYDNLALESVWKTCETVLCSDAGSPFDLVEQSWWVRVSLVGKTLRTLNIAIDQQRDLRKRVLLRLFKTGECAGTYWATTTRMTKPDDESYAAVLAKKGRAPPLMMHPELDVARMRTRLNAFSEPEQRALIRWGYALCDAAMRAYVLDDEPARGTLPFA